MQDVFDREGGNSGGGEGNMVVDPICDYYLCFSWALKVWKDGLHETKKVFEKLKDFYL